MSIESSGHKLHKREASMHNVEGKASDFCLLL